MVHSLQNGICQERLVKKMDDVNSSVRFNKERKEYRTNSNSRGFESTGDKTYATYSLPRERVPKIVWEPGILAGYRPMNKPWIFYFRSLFWIHNDTGNVWTHLLSPLFTLALLHKFTEHIDFYNNLSTQGLLVFTVGSGCMFLFSSMAHLLHSKSETAHYLTFCFDYMGIALYGYGQGMLTFYCSGNALFYETIGSTFHWISVVFASSCTFGNTLARTLYWKPCFMKKFLQVSPCALNFTCCQLPVLFRVYECWSQSNCTDNPNYFHAATWGFLVLNGALFSLHQPERSFPGKFDIWGHGHQWFHLGVLTGTMFILYASYVDLFIIPQKVLLKAQPNVINIWAGFSLVVLINLGIIMLFYCIYKKRPVKAD